MARRVLVTDATGLIGGRLAAALSKSGWVVRCMVRDGTGALAHELEQSGFGAERIRVARWGDILRPETVRGAGEDVDAARYLIHSMGRARIAT